MNEVLAKTNIPLMVGYLGVCLALLYGLVINPGWVDFADLSEGDFYSLAVVGVVAMYIFIRIFKARSLSLNGDQVEIRYIFLPSKVVSVSVHDVMMVSDNWLALPGSRMLHIRASRSGDEKETLEAVNTVAAEARENFKEVEANASWYTDKKKLRQKHVAELRQKISELIIDERLICVPKAAVRKVEERLRPYINNNLRPAYEAQQKRLAENQ